jgi:hypothetical protein
MSADGVLPRRYPGHQTRRSMLEWRERIDRFCTLILQIITLDFAVGSRGWCYILERHGLLKGDFDAAQRLITDCRKSGDLPLDICAEDASRETIGIEQTYNDIETEADEWIDHLRNRAHEQYTPISFWDDLDVYVEVAVEKLDLRNLFAPVCEEFHVPITNFKGWSDLNSRAAMMRRFKEHESQGRRCVALLCGDHDPGGLHIVEMFRVNLADLGITRFGLNADFIDQHALTWIDNLETSSGQRLDDARHKDNGKRYVRKYIEQFGARKCEANALVVEPEIGRDLCRSAILEHVPADAPVRYNDALERAREQLHQAILERIA